MSDLKAMKLRGRVREVVVENPFGGRSVWSFDREGRFQRQHDRHSDGRELTTTYRYDDKGNLIYPKRVEPKVMNHADGSSTEIEVLPARDNLGWARVRGLPQTVAWVAFPTRAASTVEVSYDKRGFATSAVFYDGTRKIVSQVDFDTDARGNVIQAAQYSIIPFIPHLCDEYNLRASIEAGRAEARVVIRYDRSDRPIEQVSYALDQIQYHATYTYNEHGDQFTEVRDEPGRETAKTAYEYEYDSHQNWTRQVVRHSSGSYETNRSITYYED